MPHFKCVACRSRLHTQESPANELADVCPGCESLLEPVGDLAEIVGFQAIKPLRPSLGDGAASTHEQICDLLTRDAILAQARLDAHPPLVDGGSPYAVSVSLVPPEARS